MGRQTNTKDVVHGSNGYTYYAYEADRDVLAQVRSEFGGTTLSQYDYVTDAAGRRTEIARSGTAMSETVGGAVTDSNFSFVYDGYLCIQRLNATTRNVKLIFTWDPLEKVATRPLMVEKPGKYKMHVTHDGNKNVSELVFFSGGSGIAAHYEYAPFGAVTASTRSTSLTAYDFRTYNPFRFSSEYADDTLGLLYYNYRHYNPMDGRWTSRDPLFGKNKYLYVDNTIECDFIGLWPCDDVCTEGAIEVDRVDIKTVPSLWDETYDAEGMISFIGKASTLTSMMSGGISGGMAGGVRYVGPTAVAEGLKSESDGNMIDLYVKLIKKSSGRFSGNKVYTRAHVKRCECVPCFFVWSRLDWVEEEGSWEPCKIGGVEFAGDYIIPNLTEKIINRCKDDRVNKELGIKSSKNGRMRR